MEVVAKADLGEGLSGLRDGVRRDVSNCNPPWTDTLSVRKIVMTNSGYFTRYDRLIQMLEQKGGVREEETYLG